MQVSIGFPCYNEEAAIPEVLQRLEQVLNALKDQGFQPQVIIVDDGSTDRSVELIQKFHWVELYRQPKNHGYGAALKKCFELARGERLITLDLDRTYFVEDIPLLLKASIETGSDIVMGTRPFDNSGMPGIRSLGNKIFVHLNQILFPQAARDLTTGFRAINSRRFNEIRQLEADNFSFTMQLTLYSLVQN